MSNKSFNDTVVGVILLLLIVGIVMYGDPNEYLESDETTEVKKVEIMDVGVKQTLDACTCEPLNELEVCECKPMTTKHEVSPEKVVEAVRKTEALSTEQVVLSHDLTGGEMEQYGN